MKDNNGESTKNAEGCNQNVLQTPSLQPDAELLGKMEGNNGLIRDLIKKKEEVAAP
jgi:hypothetical protein